MVASAVPGEGKTFTSVNLALSMRLEEDVTVLLVDGDVVVYDSLATEPCGLAGEQI
jgi:Mrp family chromosome partitioning ATPase